MPDVGVDRTWEILVAAGGVLKTAVLTVVDLFVCSFCVFVAGSRGDALSVARMRGCHGPPSTKPLLFRWPS